MVFNQHSFNQPQRYRIFLKNYRSQEGDRIKVHLHRRKQPHLSACLHGVIMLSLLIIATLDDTKINHPICAVSAKVAKTSTVPIAIAYVYSGIIMVNFANVNTDNFWLR
jgi:hypothetical protein